MILSLFWKDLRLTVPVLLAAGLLSAAPYLCVSALALTMAPGPFPWAEVLLAGTHFGQWLLLIVCALLGGNAFACEREDESVRFLTALPIRARDVLFSKVIVTLTAFECLWIVSAAISRAVTPFAAIGYRDTLPGAVDMPALAAASVLALGLSWFWSTLLAKPVVAGVCGLLSSGFVYFVLYAGASVFLPKEGTRQIEDLSLPAVILGVIASIAACSVFLARYGRRTTPARYEVVDTSAAAAGDGAISQPSTGRLGNQRCRRFFALVWKDWRLARIMVVAGTGFAAIPYIGAGAFALAAQEPFEGFAGASTVSLWLCCAVSAMWGGYVVAAERRSGTEHFLDALPVTRSRTVVSKLTVTALPCLLVHGVNAALTLAFHAAVFLPSPIDKVNVPFFDMTWPLLLWQQASLLFALPAMGAPIVCFGVAWLASARLSSNKPFLGIAAGGASAFVVLAGWLAFSTYIQDVWAPLVAALVYALLGALSAAACVVWGWRALVMREPS